MLFGRENSRLKTKAILGIDTSCYTTSFALVDLSGKLIDEERQILKVEEGSRGLSQSGALFCHTRDGGILLKNLFSRNDVELIAVVVSIAPRPVENSYMPVFLAGKNMAEVISTTHNIPLFTTTHQEGHVRAALYNNNFSSKTPFFAVHLSGGTSEILLVEQMPSGYNIQIVGGTNDLQAGSLVDRLGVKMGLAFPCGKEMDALAINSQEGHLRFATRADEGYFSLSGAEAQGLKAIASGIDKAEVCQATFYAIAKALMKSLTYLSGEYQIKETIFVGGVSGSAFLQEKLKKSLGGKLKMHFAAASFCSDNAIGVALLGLEKYNRLVEE